MKMNVKGKRVRGRPKSESSIQVKNQDNGGRPQIVWRKVKGKNKKEKEKKNI